MTSSPSGGDVVGAEVGLPDVGPVNGAAVTVTHDLLGGHVEDGVDGQGYGRIKEIGGAKLKIIITVNLKA